MAYNFVQCLGFGSVILIMYVCKGIFLSIKQISFTDLFIIPSTNLFCIMYTTVYCAYVCNGIFLSIKQIVFTDPLITSSTNFFLIMFVIVYHAYSMLVMVSYLTCKQCGVYCGLLELFYVEIFGIKGRVVHLLEDRMEWVIYVLMCSSSFL